MGDTLWEAFLFLNQIWAFDISAHYDVEIHLDNSKSDFYLVLKIESSIFLGDFVRMINNC